MIKNKNKNKTKAGTVEGQKNKNKPKQKKSGGNSSPFECHYTHLESNRHARQEGLGQNIIIRYTTINRLR